MFKNQVFQTDEWVIPYNFERSRHPPTRILLKFIMYLHPIQNKKNVKFQVSTPFRFQIITLYITIVVLPKFGTVPKKNMPIYLFLSSQSRRN